MSQRKGRGKKKNSLRLHSNPSGIGYFMLRCQWEVAKQSARPKDNKIVKAAKKLFGKLKRGDR